MTENVVDAGASEGLPKGAPPIVSAEEWQASRDALLVKEKAQTRARDALAAERRRMPWMAVEKDYALEGPGGRVSLHSQTPLYKWWNWNDSYRAEAAPDPKWVEVSTAGEAAFRRDPRDK